MGEIQGAKDEGAGSVRKYMTKPESDGNAADWLLSRADSKVRQNGRDARCRPPLQEFGRKDTRFEQDFAQIAMVYAIKNRSKSGFVT